MTPPPLKPAGPKPATNFRVRALRDGLVLAALLVSGLLVLQEVARGWAGDPYLYWATSLDEMFHGWVLGGTETYAYSPAWAQGFYPFTQLPWPVFRILWLVIGLAATLWLAVPVSRFWRPAFVALCMVEVIAGNIVLLMAVTAVVALRHPALWAFVLLSKITPGVALGWYVGRREWRSLAIAIGATAGLVLISFLWVPDSWFSWAETLLANRDSTGVAAASSFLPLWPRLAAGIAIAVWGGYSGRAWTIPVAMLLATPHIWLQAFVILAAIPRLQAASRSQAPRGAAAQQQPVALAQPE
jgi:hypothetical protein